jgi:hypothetical protein
MLFEIECDASKALHELYHKERCTFSPRQQRDPARISWYCHDAPVDDCFLDERGVIVSRTKQKREWQRHYKLAVAGKSRGQMGYVLSERVAALVLKQAEVCDVVFRCSEDYDDRSEQISMTAADIRSEPPLVLQFGKDYRVLKEQK